MFLLVRNMSAAVRNLLSSGQGVIFTPTVSSYNQLPFPYLEEPKLLSIQSDKSKRSHKKTEEHFSNEYNSPERVGRTHLRTRKNTSG